MNITKMITESQVQRIILQLERINDLIDSQMRDFGDFRNYEVWKDTEKDIAQGYQFLILLREKKNFWRLI